jgi:hypothetical protein
LKLAINQLLNSVGSQTHEVSLGLAGGDGFSDLEAPFPRARLDLRKGEINGLAVHDFAHGKDASLTSSVANNFESTLRPDSLHARRFLKGRGSPGEIYFSIGSSLTMRKLYS